ncbi:MAG: hypothetical protein ABL890_04270 [Candidatus Peribacteraceae bacterium]
MTRFQRFLQAIHKICLTPGEKVAYHPISGVINEADVRLNLSMDEKQFFASASEIRLLPHEKVAIREALFRQAAAPWWQMRLMRMSSMVSALLIVSILSGGVTFAAENTVPGDILYPVKIHVNERLMHTMARTEDDKAMVETKRAARRIAEAETLVKRHTFSEEKQDMLASAVDSHMRVVRTRMDTLSRENRPASLRTLSAHVDATLKEKSRELKKMRDISAEPLLEKVREERVNAQVMELTAVMNDEDASIAMPEMPAASDIAAFESEAVPAAVMMRAVPALLDENVEAHEEMEEEMLLATEARLTVVRMQMETMSVADSTTDDAPQAAMMMIEEESSSLGNEVDPALPPEVLTKSANMELSVPVATFSATPASPPVESTPEEMVRQAEEEIRTGDAPGAMRTATSALEKVREMKHSGKGSGDDWKPAAPKNDEERTLPESPSF